MMAAKHLNTPSCGLFERYETGEFYDEMFAAPGEPRPHYAELFRTLAEKGHAPLRERRATNEGGEGKAADDVSHGTILAEPRLLRKACPGAPGL